LNPIPKIIHELDILQMQLQNLRSIMVSTLI